MSANDPFLHELHDRLHDTATQRKMRKLRPMPVGVVFIEWPGMTDEDIRAHLRLMKQLGFTCLKGIMTCRISRQKIMHMALDEGIIPWWYDEGGYAEPTPQLLESLGLPADMPMDQLRTNEKFVAHQMSLMRARIDRKVADAGMADTVDSKIPFSFDNELHDAAVPHFVEWLKKTYGSVKAVMQAWNFDHAGIGAGGKRRKPAEPWKTWKDVEQGLRHVSTREYRNLRDILRFKADVMLNRLRERVAAAKAEDADVPFRAGGEMGLFLPFAARATDMEGVAEIMADGGSFYPSIHLAWHFEEVDFELPRPVYMQASTMCDFFKGGWAGPWESTGGPQQLSGGKAPFWPPAQDETPGFTVDEGVMTQLMLSYLAAGFRGFGFWCWSCRTAGWEAGEYALLDRNNQVTERARTAGRIGQAAARWRDELWTSHKEPLVGILSDWNCDAIWAAMSVHGRDKYKHVPVRARIGASRALINNNVPFEYVTARNIKAGLAPRYKCIYLPAIIAIDDELMPLLEQYVRDGGRLVIDMPSAWYDTFGRLLMTAPGTAFERIFGCSISDFQYSRNVPWSIGGRRLEGFVLDLQPTTARTVASFDSGKPAVTENSLGAGTAVIIGHEMSLTCVKPGNEAGEAELVRYALGGCDSPLVCEGALVYRRSAAMADHYFFVNDAPARTVRLKTPWSYSSVNDAVSDAPVSLDAVELPAYGGRWVRAAK